jgi:Domain of unknown function (DUF1707)
MPVPEPHLRASDADRAAVAASLGEHMAAGRITLAEYDERVARAYAARTFGDLAELTADLPGGTVPWPTPAAPAAAPRPAPVSLCGAGYRRHGGRNSSWQSWRSISLIVLAIWLVTSIGSGALLPFWPMWVIVPWGVMLLAGRLSGGHPGGHGNHPRLHS